jgi:hypothetical protein
MEPKDFLQMVGVVQNLLLPHHLAIALLQMKLEEASLWL